MRGLACGFILPTADNELNCRSKNGAYQRYQSSDDRSRRSRVRQNDRKLSFHRTPLIVSSAAPGAIPA